MDIGTTVISAAGTITSVLTADTGEAIVIPGDAWFLRAEFERSGPDLKLTGPDGQKLLIRDYFSQENPPDLTTSDGVVLKGDIAVRLAGPLAPGQYAQATATTDNEPIGRVESSTGKAEVVRADGTRETLQQGSPIFQGDILETGEDGSIGIVFADESTFSLGESGRMTLDEMVYDPGQQTGSMKVSLLQGAFTFVSGEIAKTDPNAMTMTTPTATIGIRGTAAGGRVDKAGVTTAAVLPEIGGGGVLPGLDDAAASATKPTDERFELPNVEKLVGAVHAAITSGDVVRDPLVRLQAAGAISLTPASPLSFDSTSWATPPPASKLRPSSSEACSSDPSASSTKPDAAVVSTPRASSSSRSA